MALLPITFSIMKMYQLYRDNKLIVNRSYQRKLVWSLEEKRSLIDSILNEFPVPLILLANFEEKYEIIDGIQRLNAIFGFIENEFDINISGDDFYFDSQLFVSAKTFAEKGSFEPVEGEGIKYLNNDLSSSFLEYQLPTTTFTAGNNETINETFKRINSNGKHLSPQEVRQAGILTKFSNLVRELGAEFRGDVSKDILPLTEMPKISIDAKGSKLRYGVLAEDTFWCKQGILSASQLRESEDEQFIADLILSIALKTPFPASKESFDNYYGKNTPDKSNEIENAINIYGVGALKDDIKYVFSIIKGVVESSSDGKNLKQIMGPNTNRNPSKEPFYTLFMAVYNLMVLDNKELLYYDPFFEAIDDLSSKTKSKSHYVKSADRSKNINLCIGLIQSCFVMSSRPRSPGPLAIDFENYLRRSKVEGPIYDFKQGLYPLTSHNREINDRTFEKYFENIAALSNLGKNKKGCLFIGVTDKEEDTKKIEKLDNQPGVPRFDQFGVVGLEREAILKKVSLDEYILFISQKIRDSELPDWLKTKLNTSMMPITYKGFTVLMIEIENGSSPVWYNGKLFIRDGASHRAAKMGEEINSIYNLFK